MFFNEESRIENFIKCFSWSDDLILLDKSSTDKSKEIIKKYISHNIHYIKVPYHDSMNDFHARTALEHSKNEWIMPITASDLIDPELVNLVYKTINSEFFFYSEVLVPYKMYTFGICDKHSPWYNEYKPLVYRKNQFFFSGRVHEERGSSGEKYTITDRSCGYFYHLTHRNLDVFYERHIRYAGLETEKYDDPVNARKKTIRGILGAIKYVFWKKKSHRLGWDGIALALAYISYFIMNYLTVWQKFNKKGEVIYSKITDDVLKRWDLEKLQ